MPISEQHPSSSNTERPEDRLLESFFAAAKGWREYDTPEGADKENRILLGAVRAIIDHALPHLRPEDVPGVLETLAERAERMMPAPAGTFYDEGTRSYHMHMLTGKPLASWLRQQKEPRDD